MNRKLQLVGLAVLAALVIAFVLRDVVEQVIIRPLVYLFWIVGLLYRLVPQPILWVLLVVVMIFLALSSVVGKIALPFARPHKSRPVQGPVRELAMQIERKEGGIYFKWQIARTLSQLALDMQELRLHTRRRTLEFDPGPAVLRVRHYLEAGLNTSFSDYPIPGGFARLKSFFRSAGLKLAQEPIKPGSGALSTPFDGDIDPVIDYLEAEMENNDDLRRP